MTDFSFTVRNLIASTLFLATPLASAATLPKFGPVGHPYAIPLSQDHSYFASSPDASPEFWLLISHYVPQINEADCSAAALVIALNAARDTLPQTSEDKLISQQVLIERFGKIDDYAERMAPPAVSNPLKKMGATLAVLRDVAAAAFRAYGFPKATAQVYYVSDLSDASLRRVHAALADANKGNGTYLVANFAQKEFTADPEGDGHFSPVGAYDAEHKRVLILDVDREWYEPYWVDEKRFAEAMHTPDSEGKVTRGYVLIRTKP